ncbi:MAG: FAD-dependent oxidoreductase [Acidobacteriota bacterium]
MAQPSRRRLLKLLAASASGSLLSCDGWKGAVPSRSSAASRVPLAYLRTNWSRDPFAFGSYSFVSRRSPGVGESDRATLEEPIDSVVFFAGEALNPNYQSSVHAAHESGLRANRAVLAAAPRTVAIVGAGMAGLTAASGLAREGVGVTVLEARDRIGGRVLTADALGTPVDLGATWIHGPDGNPLSALADELGMERVETDDTYVVRGRGGRKLGALSTPAWLEDVAEATPTGTGPGDLNEQYLTEVYPKYGVGYPGRDVKFPQGYSTIFEALEGDYEVRLSSQVRRIAQTEGGVEVELADEVRETFDVVLVTVPLGVLKARTIVFEPELPAPKTAAIERMGMGVLDKLYLRFEEAFWDEDTVILTPDNDLPQGHFNYWVNFHRYLDEPILMAFNSGDSARELASSTDEELLEMATSTLALAYPPLDPGSRTTTAR